MATEGLVISGPILGALRLSTRLEFGLQYRSVTVSIRYS